MASNWRPPSDLYLHSGVVVSDDHLFLINPPEEIGELISVGTTITNKRQSNILRMLIALTIASVGIVLGVLGFVFDPDDLSRYVWLVLFSGFGIAGGLVYYFDKHKLMTSFVGKKGIANFYFKDVSGFPIKSEVMRSANAAEVKKKLSAINVNNNGVSNHVRTNYRFQRLDRSGETLFLLKGFCRMDPLPASTYPNDPFFFAQMAERAYSRYKVHELEKELVETGKVVFSAGAGKEIVVAEDHFEFIVDGVTDRIDFDEVAEFLIDNGAIKIKTKDASLVSSRGRYRFPFSELGNGELFMNVVEATTDIEILYYEYV